MNGLNVGKYAVRLPWILWVIGGSSQLVYVDNDHGDRKSPNHGDYSPYI